MFEKIKFEQADRVIKQNENINTIKKCDIENVLNKLEDNNNNEEKKNRIGFAC